MSGKLKLVWKDSKCYDGEFNEIKSKIGIAVIK